MYRFETAAQTSWTLHVRSRLSQNDSNGFGLCSQAAAWIPMRECEIDGIDMES